MTTLQRVKHTIETRQLLAKGHSVLIALSGGPDSVALLHLLSRLRKSYRLKLGAVYINHQIRPRAAKKEERFCQKLCDRLGVPLTIVREDVPALAKKRGLGLEEMAREIRYAVFDNLARAQKCDRVALGHHADDQVETILFRLVRGTGPSGVAGMPYRRGAIIRPLLDLSRAEIIAYLKKNSLTWCEDTSNRSVRFRRNWIRHRLLPELRRHLNPQVESAILSLADTVREEDLYLTGLVNRAIRKTVRITPGGKIELALESYRNYAKWIGRRLLRHCLKVTCPGGLAPAKNVIERLDSLASTKAGTLSLPGRIQAKVSGNRLYIWRRRSENVRAEFQPGRRLVLAWPRIRFAGRVVDRKSVSVIKRPGARRVWLDWSKLRPPMVIRTFRPGDKFRPLGMKGHKKISDFLSDRKVPQLLRDEVLLLCDRQGPVWIVGHEIAERAKVDDKTERVLTVAVSIRQEADGPIV